MSVRFRSALELVCYRVSDTRVAAGERLEVTLYLRSLGVLGREFTVSTEGGYQLANERGQIPLPESSGWPVGSLCRTTHALVAERDLEAERAVELRVTVRRLDDRLEPSPEALVPSTTPPADADPSERGSLLLRHVHVTPREPQR